MILQLQHKSLDPFDQKLKPQDLGDDNNNNNLYIKSPKNQGSFKMLSGRGKQRDTTVSSKVK